MRFLTKEKFNINYIVNFLFISTVFALLQNFGINENKYIAHLSIGASFSHFVRDIVMSLVTKNLIWHGKCRRY